MSDLVFEILKIVVMVAVLVVTRYVVPWLKNQIDASKINEITSWAMKAVLSTQQVQSAKTGKERKEIVTEFLRGILIEKNISISDEQLDALIEAAVKQMKIAENAGTTEGVNG